MESHRISWTDEHIMKKRKYLVWPAVIFTAFALTASCGGKDGDSGDGDGDAGDGDGDTGDGDGDTGDGDGDTGDGDSGGNGGNGGNGGSDGLTCDEECTDDGNPCTEDACNPETGECGIPRNGNPCDDGIYCNGADTCDAGECTAHQGNPCGNPEACDEGGDVCGCETVADCPGDDLSEHEFGGADQWGVIGPFNEGVYDNECDEASSCSANKTLYTCNGDMECVASNSVVTDTTCETRDTDADPCTQNSNYCDGSEVCDSGICTSPGDPCASNVDQPFCDETGNDCDSCIDEGDCGGAEQCCRGECIPDSDSCFIIGNVVPTPVVATPVIGSVIGSF